MSAIECPICASNYSRDKDHVPVQFGVCGHSICRECSNRLAPDLSRDRLTANEIRCPHCRLLSPKYCISPNFALMNALDEDKNEDSSSQLSGPTLAQKLLYEKAILQDNLLVFRDKYEHAASLYREHCRIFEWMAHLLQLKRGKRSLPKTESERAEDDLAFFSLLPIALKQKSTNKDYAGGIVQNGRIVPNKSPNILRALRV